MSQYIPIKLSDQPYIISEPSPHQLLIEAIDADISKDEVDAILCNINSIYFLCDGHYGKYQGVIAAVCRAKRLETLKDLLFDTRLEPMPMLEVLDTLIVELDEDLFDEWFDDLNDIFEFNVNEYYRGYETLLERALFLERNTAIKKLCKAGAYIGSKIENYSEENGYLIDKMDPKVLEEIFDSCITSQENSKSNEFVIRFNYKNFLCPKNLNYASEMTPISRILQTEELLHLLKHPLITSLMAFKWPRISRIFYLNLVLFCFFGLSMIAYIIIMCETKYFGADSVFEHVTWYLAILGLSFIVIRELLQLVHQSITYLTMPSNYMEIILIYFCFETLTMKFEVHYSKISVVFTILLMAWELRFLVGHLPILSMSTHMLMLEEVLRTFLKSFSLYSIFIVTFSLCFYILFGTENGKNDPKDEAKFESVFKSIAKTMAMVVGELDFGSLNFQGFFSYVLFLLFVICMTVVLMNLLNGLAISDIQKIKDQAELNELICRANLLSRYSLKCLDICSLHCFCKCTLIVHPNAVGSPNEVNFLVESACLERKSSPSETNYWSSLFNNENVRQVMDSLNGKCTAMGSAIVKRAMKVLKKEKTALEKIEEKLNDIENIVRKILENNTVNEC